MPVEAAERLERIGRDPDGTLLVATGFDGAVIGLVAVHWCTMMQQERPVARITTMVVDDRERRRGIGRMLMKAAAQAARAAGCDVLELTTALHRAEAQAFYQSIGFTLTAQRFSRSLAQEQGLRDAGWRGAADPAFPCGVAGQRQRDGAA